MTEINNEKDEEKRASDGENLSQNQENNLIPLQQATSTDKIKRKRSFMHSLALFVYTAWRGVKQVFYMSINFISLCIILLCITLLYGKGQNIIIQNILPYIEEISGYTIKISPIEGNLLTTSSIENVEISDKEGTWLTAKNIAFDWKPTFEINKFIHITNFSASEIKITRLPEQEDRDLSDKKAIRTLKDLDEFIKTLPIIKVKKIDVRDLMISKNVVKPAIHASLKGNLDTETKKLNIDFENKNEPEVTAKLKTILEANNYLNIKGSATLPASYMNQLAKINNLSGKIESEFDVNYKDTDNIFAVEFKSFKAKDAKNKVDFKGNIKLTKNKITIKNIKGTVNKGIVNIDGTIEKEKLDLKGKIKDLPIDIQYEIYDNISLENSIINADFNIAGTTKKPSGNIKLNIKSNSQTIQGIKALNMQLDLIAKDNIINLTTIATLNNEPLFDLKANNKWSEKFINDIQNAPLSTNLDLNTDLKLLEILGISSANNELRGKIKLLSSIDGTVNKPIINNGSIDINDIHYYVSEDLEINKTNAKIALNRQGQSTRFNITNANGILTKQPFNLTAYGFIHDNSKFEIADSNMTIADGTVKTSLDYTAKTDQFNLNSDINNIALYKIVEPIFTLKQGILSGNIKLSNSLENPNGNYNLLYTTTPPKFASKKGEPNIIKVELNGLLQQKTVNGKLLVNGRINSENKTLGQAGYKIYLPNKNSRLRFTSDFNVDSLTFAELVLTRDYEIKGRLRGNLDGRDTGNDFVLNGQMQTEEASFKYVKYGTLLQNIQLFADINNNRLNFKKLTATDKDNNIITGEGYIQFSGNIKPIDIKLNTKRFKALDGGYGTGYIVGNAGILGTMDEFKIYGDLTLDDADILIPASANPNILQLNIVHPDKEQRLAKKKTIPLDIKIAMGQPVYIRGYGLESQLTDAIHIVGDVNKPVVNGTINLKRGRYTFLDNKFTVTKGYVKFLQSRPYLYVQAETKKSKTTIYANISGRPDKLKFKLTSNPPMPQDEVIAFLLFGRSKEQLTPFQAIQLANALGTLSGKTSNLDILGKVRSTLNLDDLNISSGENQGVTVGVGEYIDDNVYLGIEHENGDRTDTRARIEIELTPNITVEAQGGALPKSNNIELNWKMDY